MWVNAAKMSDLPPGKSRVALVNGVEIALFNVDGTVHAIENSCLHRDGPLAEGHLEGSQITCPWHAWRFDVKTGECLSSPGSGQISYPVKISGDDVFVEVK